MGEFKENLSRDMHSTLWYTSMGIKWSFIALIVGVICGPVGAVFSDSIALATDFRSQYPWLLYCMPLAGLFIVFMYRSFHVAGAGTNDIIKAARHGHPLKFLLIPAIFIGTVLTHLTGGSAGREGAALQIGGDIGNHVGKMLHLGKNELKVVTRVGMAAFFSALFGTPLAAAAFGTMVVNVGQVPYLSLFPALVASIIAAYIAANLGAAPVAFKVVAPSYDPIMYLKIMALAVLCAIVSILFVKTLLYTHHAYDKYIKNPYIKVVVGAVLIILLTTILGTTDYNGAGMNSINNAILKGEVVPYAFLMKIIFTAITLEAGFKGGEVVPSFFIGATFGCFVSKLLGIPPTFGAAIGMIGVFCGATNTFLSSLFLAIEVFGGQGLLFFAITCIICYLFSGYSGLYSSQRILYSKVDVMEVNANPNLYHTGDTV